LVRRRGFEHRRRITFHLHNPAERRAGLRGQRLACGAAGRHDRIPLADKRLADDQLATLEHQRVRVKT